MRHRRYGNMQSSMWENLVKKNLDIYDTLLVQRRDHGIA